MGVLHNQYQKDLLAQKERESKVQKKDQHFSWGWFVGLVVSIYGFYEAWTILKPYLNKSNVDINILPPLPAQSTEAPIYQAPTQELPVIIYEASPTPQILQLPTPEVVWTPEPPRNPLENIKIVKEEANIYTFKDSGFTLNYVFQTDESKSKEPIRLSRGYNKDMKNADEIMATAITDAIYRSYLRQHGGVWSQEGYANFMRQWAKYQATGVNSDNLIMRFKAYVDGEKTPRMVEVPVPNYQIPIIFVDENKMEQVNAPTTTNTDSIRTMKSWLYLVNGRITLVVGSPLSNVHADRRYQAEETTGLSLVLATLSGNNTYKTYQMDFYTNLDGDGQIILK